MCGRFSLAESVEKICKRFDAVFKGKEWLPRYNMAPAQPLPTVILGKDGERELSPMVWGLIPHWAKDRKIGYKMINARAETLNEKPSFKMPLRKQRCLIPADGFYEWKHKGKNKIPLRVCMQNGSLFAMAGLWEVWKDQQREEEIHSFTIVTTKANSLLQQVHDRMPAILLPKDEHLWLEKVQEDESALLRMLQPYPAEKMKMYQVSPIVNSWKNDVKECILPVE